MAFQQKIPKPSRFFPKSNMVIFITATSIYSNRQKAVFDAISHKKTKTRAQNQFANMENNCSCYKSQTLCCDFCSFFFFSHQWAGHISQRNPSPTKSAVVFITTTESKLGLMPCFFFSWQAHSSHPSACPALPPPLGMTHPNPRIWIYHSRGSGYIWLTLGFVPSFGGPSAQCGLLPNPSLQEANSP